MNIKGSMQQIGQAARDASHAVARAPTGVKNAALIAMAKSIRNSRAVLLAANAADITAAQADGLDAALIDRLTLTEKGIEAMAQGLEQVATLPDPVGEISDMKRRPSGIQVGKMRVPLGVVGIIYEARPNVTADAAALCLKSGNAAICVAARKRSTAIRRLPLACATDWLPPVCRQLRCRSSPRLTAKLSVI